VVETEIKAMEAIAELMEWVKTTFLGDDQGDTQTDRGDSRQGGGSDAVRLRPTRLYDLWVPFPTNPGKWELDSNWRSIQHYSCELFGHASFSPDTMTRLTHWLTAECGKSDALATDIGEVVNLLKAAVQSKRAADQVAPANPAVPPLPLSTPTPHQQCEAEYRALLAEWHEAIAGIPKNSEVYGQLEERFWYQCRTLEAKYAQPHLSLPEPPEALEWLRRVKPGLDRILETAAGGDWRAHLKQADYWLRKLENIDGNYPISFDETVKSYLCARHDMTLKQIGQLTWGEIAAILRQDWERQNPPPQPQSTAPPQGTAGAVDGAALAAADPQPGDPPTDGTSDPAAGVVLTDADTTILHLLAKANRALKIAQIVREAAELIREMGGPAARAAGLVTLSETTVRERVPILEEKRLVSRPLGPKGSPTKRKAIGITEKGRVRLKPNSSAR
jgi:hypothetical protein